MGGCVNRSIRRQKLPRIPQSILNLPKANMKAYIYTIGSTERPLGWRKSEHAGGRAYCVSA